MSPRTSSTWRSQGGTRFVVSLFFEHIIIIHVHGLHAHPPSWRSPPWSHLCPPPLWPPPRLVAYSVGTLSFLCLVFKSWLRSHRMFTRTLTAVSSASRSFITPPMSARSGPGELAVKQPLLQPDTLHLWTNTEPPSWTPSRSRMQLRRSHRGIRRVRSGPVQRLDSYYNSTSNKLLPNPRHRGQSGRLWRKSVEEETGLGRKLSDRETPLLSPLPPSSSHLLCRALHRSPKSNRHPAVQ